MPVCLCACACLPVCLCMCMCVRHLERMRRPMHIHTQNKHTHTHTHTLSLSLSLFFSVSVCELGGHRVLRAIHGVGAGGGGLVSHLSLFRCLTGGATGAHRQRRGTQNPHAHALCVTVSLSLSRQRERERERERERQTERERNVCIRVCVCLCVVWLDEVVDRHAHACARIHDQCTDVVLGWAFARSSPSIEEALGHMETALLPPRDWRGRNAATFKVVRTHTHAHTHTERSCAHHYMLWHCAVCILVVTRSHSRTHTQLAHSHTYSRILSLSWCRGGRCGW
jgi:hypothetical protein